MFSRIFIRTTCLLTVTILIASTAALSAADWPSWRGAKRNGVVENVQLPKTWPKQLKRLWQVEVGEGHSAPVVADERIFQFSRLGDKETMSCFDLAGKLIWRDQYAAPYKMHSAAKGHGKGPKSTPAVFDDRVFALGISGTLSGYSVDQGNLLWRREFSKQYKKTSPLYGTSMSPLAKSKFVVAHVGGHDSGAFTAFAASSGKPIWTWDKDGPGYTSPMVAKLGGVTQLITQSQQQNIALDARGQLLWSIPYKTGYDQNSVTPIVYNDTVIFSGYKRGVTAYRIQKEGDHFTTSEAWHNDKASFYMSSPVLMGSRLYGFSERNSGQLVCLSAGDGKVLWEGPGRQGDNATLLAAGNTLLSLSTKSELVVCKIGTDDYEEIARYEVADSPTWAHIGIAGNRLLIKDKQTLAMWTWAER